MFPKKKKLPARNPGIFICDGKSLKSDMALRKKNRILDPIGHCTTVFVISLQFFFFQ